MSETTNLHLFERDPNTEGSAFFSVKEMLNDNWDKIDAAHGSLASRVSAAETALALPGVYIYSGSYTGTGADVNRKISTTKKPWLVVVGMANGDAMLKCWRPFAKTECINSSFGTYQQQNDLTWANDGVTIAQTFGNAETYMDKFNAAGTTYYWTAFCTEA